MGQAERVAASRQWQEAKDHAQDLDGNHCYDVAQCLEHWMCMHGHRPYHAGHMGSAHTDTESMNKRAVQHGQDHVGTAVAGGSCLIAACTATDRHTHLPTAKAVLGIVRQYPASALEVPLTHCNPDLR